MTPAADVTLHLPDGAEWRITRDPQLADSPYSFSTYDATPEALRLVELVQRGILGSVASSPAQALADASAVAARRGVVSDSLGRCLRPLAGLRRQGA